MRPRGAVDRRPARVQRTHPVPETNDSAGRGSDVNNVNRTFAVVPLCAALAVFVGAAAARAAEKAEATGAGATASPAAPSEWTFVPRPSAGPSASSAAAPAEGRASASPASGRARLEPAERAGPAPSAEGEKPASAEPLLQVTGRVVHTWEEKPGVRIMLVIDGFTVLTRIEQLTARDGVIWFDEDAARKSGKAVLGVYAETGVEYKRASGQVEKYDSVFVQMETPGEISLRSDEPLRGRADGTELFLRAKKLRQEYLARGVRETPTGVIPPPQSGPKVQPPGIREAGVPQEITIVAQDDVRQVNFTSFVEDGMRISTWSGGVYLTRGDLEMAADNLVIWTPEDALRRAGGRAGTSTEPGGAAAEPKSATRLAAEAYLEGHVRVIQGRRVLQCSQLHYDFQRDQALALNTKIRSFALGRNVPVHYYAKEVRQLARGVFVGTHAWMSTCEFAEPHYDLASKDMRLEDLTPDVGETGEKPEYRRVRFVGTDVEAEIRSLPVTHWPRLAGDVSEADTALRSIRIENRRNRGTGVATQWHLLKLLGIENEPQGFDFYLDLDAWSKAGPAIGVQSDYNRSDYYGEFLSYFIHEFGGSKDVVNNEAVDPLHQDRGRATWRHRQILPQNWELSIEASYVSDRNFLNEFFEKENRTGKQQETLVYLKKQEREQALTLLASTRVEDFYTRTEYYPQIGYNVIGHSFWQDHLTYFQDSELAVARYRPADTMTFQNGTHPFTTARQSPSTLIADTIHEVDLPLKAGPVNVVPFVEGRLSYFGHSIDGGAEGRFAAREGARAATQLWRVYDGVESEFWDVHRLRHVNIFDASASAAQVATPSRDLYPFNPTEAGTPEVIGVDGTGIVDLGWRERFQTYRGPPGRTQLVDWITTDLEAFFYSNRQSPGITPDHRKEFNRLEFRSTWQTTNMVTLWTDNTYNTDDGKMERVSVGANIVHTPRLGYVIGHRVLPRGNSAQTLVGFDYRINDKWRLTVLEQYDFDQQKNAQTDIVLTRRMHRWLMRIRVMQDSSKYGSFAGLEFQPVGVKEMKLSW